MQDLDIHPHGVNFINVIRAKNLYESLFLAAFSSYILALAKNSYEKFARKMLMKSTHGHECARVRACAAAALFIPDSANVPCDWSAEVSAAK